MNPSTVVSAKVLRVETLATRLTVAEMQAVEAAAAAEGISRSDWLRNAAVANLRQMEQAPGTPLESTILAELLGLRLVILNLFPLAIPGLAIESVRQIMAFADSAKHGEAAKVLRRQENPM